MPSGLHRPGPRTERALRRWGSRTPEPGFVEKLRAQDRQLLIAKPHRSRRASGARRLEVQAGAPASSHPWEQPLPRVPCQAPVIPGSHERHLLGEASSDHLPATGAQEPLTRANLLARLWASPGSLWMGLVAARVAQVQSQGANCWLCQGPLGPSPRSPSPPACRWSWFLGAVLWVVSPQMSIHCQRRGQPCDNRRCSWEAGRVPQASARVSAAGLDLGEKKFSLLSAPGDTRLRAHCLSLAAPRDSQTPRSWRTTPAVATCPGVPTATSPPRTQWL